jgi:acetyl esterase/lipase
MIGQFPVKKIAELWNGGIFPVDYRTDVTLGSLDGLPEIIMFSGTYDIMNIPARRFASRLKEENHPHRYIEKEGGYHVYVLGKKSKEEFELIVTEIER